MAADVLVSVSLLVGIVALSHVIRAVSARALAHTGLSPYAAELVSTFQLCCCTHELKLLSEEGGIEPGLALTLTYLASVAHGLTFGGAAGNPCGSLENAYRRRVSWRSASRQIACQFAAAVAARAALPRLWALGWSGLHARHHALGFRCASPIHAPLPAAAAVELLCACAVQTVVTRTRALKETHRVHVVAATITAVVYAGGGVTGAVFNPALAFSTQLGCGGSGLLEHAAVYWTGPVLGVAASVLLCDWILPLLMRGPHRLLPPMRTKKTT